MATAVSFDAGELESKVKAMGPEGPRVSEIWRQATRIFVGARADGPLSPSSSNSVRRAPAQATPQSEATTSLPFLDPATSIIPHYPARPSIRPARRRLGRCLTSVETATYCNGKMILVANID
jgi:hypothetical protein